MSSSSRLAVVDSLDDASSALRRFDSHPFEGVDAFTNARDFWAHTPERRHQQQRRVVPLGNDSSSRFEYAYKPKLLPLAFERESCPDEELRGGWVLEYLTRPDAAAVVSKTFESPSNYVDFPIQRGAHRISRCAPPKTLEGGFASSLIQTTRVDIACHPSCGSLLRYRALETPNGTEVVQTVLRVVSLQEYGTKGSLGDVVVLRRTLECVSDSNGRSWHDFVDNRPHTETARGGLHAWFASKGGVETPSTGLCETALAANRKKTDFS